MALALRALAGLRAQQHGTALRDLNEAVRHVVTTLDECVRQPLPAHARQLVAFLRGTCLMRIRDVPAAVQQLEQVDVRAALPAREANALAVTGHAHPVSSGGGSALDEPEAHATRVGLEHRTRVLEASRLQLGFCAAFNLGLGYWRLCRPADALRAFLSAQRCAHALARVRVAITTPPAPPPPKRGGKAPEPAPDAPPLAWPVVAPPPLPHGAAASAHVVCAQALQRLGRPAEALSHFDAGLRVQPGYLAAVLGRGDLHFDRGEVGEARRAYCRAAALHPLATAPHVRLARMYHHLQNEELAHRMVRQALRLDPKDAGALEARAILRLGSGQAHAALSDLTSALASPSAPPYGTSLWKALLCEAAAVYAHLGNRREATRLYAQAAGCLSGSSSALLGLGTLALVRKRFADAAALYDATLELLDADERRFALDDAQLRPAELMATVITAADGTPAQSGGGGGGKGGGAAAAAGGAAAGGGGAGLLAAAAALGGGKEASARDALSRMRAQRGRAALGAAVAYLCEGQLEPARARMQEAIALRGSCGRTQFNRGVFHLVAGECEAAEADLLACVKLMPTNVEAWLRKSAAIVRQEATKVEAGRKQQVRPKAGDRLSGVAGPRDRLAALAPLDAAPPH